MENCYSNLFIRSFFCLLALTSSSVWATEEPRLFYAFYEAANEVYDEMHGEPLFFGSSETYYDMHDPWLLPQRGLYFKSTSYATVAEFTLTRDHTIDLLMLAFPASAAGTVLFKASDSGFFLHASHNRLQVSFGDADAHVAPFAGKDQWAPHTVFVDTLFSEQSMAAHRKPGPAQTALSTSSTEATPDVTKCMASRQRAAWSRLDTCPGTSLFTRMVTLPQSS